MSTLSIHAATAISGTSDCEGIMWGTQSGSVQLVKSSDMKGARYDWKVGGGGGPASQQRGGVASLRCTEIVGGNSFSVMTDDYSVFVGDVHACGKWTHIIPSEIVKGDGSHRTTSSLLAPSPCNESLLVAAVGPSRVIRFADVRQKKLLKDLKLALVPTSVSLRMDGAFMAVGSESAALVYDLRSLKSPIIKFEEVPARSLSFYRHYDYEEESHTPKASTPRGKQGVSKSLTPHTQRLAGMLKRIGAPARPTNSDTTNNSFKSNLPSAAQSSHFLDESSRQLIVDNSSNNGDDEGGEDDGDKSPTDTSFVVADRRGSQSSAGGISMRKLTLSGGEGGAACSTADIEMLVSSLNRMHVETIGKLRYLEMRQTKMENTLASILERLDK
ncbi:hypothetical protein FOZ61_010478 [Perkinsus olseni]|nr:hypothetical protein FOZ61_010478 [Perkinsus olseni]